jgi:hypothetical protein
MRVHDRLDKIDGCLIKIDKTLIRQEETLKHHVFRTDLAEQRLDKMEVAMEPVKAHVRRTDGALKLLGIISVVSGLAAALYKVLV